MEDVDKRIEELLEWCKASSLITIAKVEEGENEFIIRIPKNETLAKHKEFGRFVVLMDEHDRYGDRIAIYRLKLNLHEAIALAIKMYGPMRVRDIARKICQDKLYVRRDGKCAPPTQISARISNYPEYFEREDGKIKLTEKGEELVKRIFEEDLFWRRI